MRDFASSHMNAYELERDKRIARNLEALKRLGVACTAKDGLNSKLSTYCPVSTGPAPKRVKLQTKTQLPERVSNRLRGNLPLGKKEIEEAVTQEDAERPSKAISRRGLALNLDGAPASPPFTLRSIGTTIWNMGEIYRGPWAQHYWSKAGCLYHHAYPIGFRATKAQFGRTYDMQIEAGLQGPIFTVTEKGSQRSFSGSSPTSPWTKVCLALRTGQRISGPLFFGFSDPITIRAIAAMYSPEELSAAQQGLRLENQQQTLPEIAAKEFCSIEGIGEAVAMVLALTNRLGGTPHRSLHSLRAWARDPTNSKELASFLLESEEVPAATRRWPAWRFRFVPKIVTALSGEAAAEDMLTKSRGGAQKRKASQRPEAIAEMVDRCECNHQNQEVGDAVGQASETAVEAPARDCNKENTTLQPASTSRKFTAAVVAVPLRQNSGRQRKPNTKFANFV